MKRILYLALMSIVMFGFTTMDTYNYNQVVTLKGVVSEVEYEMPSGDVYMTYVLKLDQTISVSASGEWEAKSDVKEVQLSIKNYKVQRYKDKPISVTGELFGAINVHHRRDVCIKVDEINM